MKPKVIDKKVEAGNLLYFRRLYIIPKDQSVTSDEV